MSEADNVIERWEPVFHSKPGDEASTLLFLPLAHVFGRMVQVAAIRGRVKLGHQPRAGGARPAARPRRLPADVHPRACRTSSRRSSTRPAARRRRRASRARSRRPSRSRCATRRPWRPRPSASGPGPSAALRMQHQFFDKLVYSKVRAAMGGRVRHAMSGGSAMDRRLGLFFAGAGVRIYEGYGLTETHRGRHRQPARAHPLRHGRPARSPARPCTSRTTARSGCTAATSSTATSTTPRPPTRCCTTAGSPPATWARSTRTAI